MRNAHLISMNSEIEAKHHKAPVRGLIGRGPLGGTLFKPIGPPLLRVMYPHRANL